MFEVNSDFCVVTWFTLNSKLFHKFSSGSSKIVYGTIICSSQRLYFILSVKSLHACEMSCTRVASEERKIIKG